MSQHGYISTDNATPNPNTGMRSHWALIAFLSALPMPSVTAQALMLRRLLEDDAASHNVTDIDAPPPDDPNTTMVIAAVVPGALVIFCCLVYVTRHTSQKRAAVQEFQAQTFVPLR